MNNTKIFCIAALLTFACKKKDASSVAASSLSIKGKLTEATQPESFITTNLTSDQDFDSATYAKILTLVPLGKLDIFCTSFTKEASKSCTMPVKSNGEFGAECAGLGGVPTQCFVRNESKILGPIWIKDSSVFVGSEGQLNLTVSLDQDTSFAFATIDKNSSTSVIAETTNGPALTGKWKVKCAQSTIGLSSECPKSGELFFANVGNGLTSVWESKSSYDKCGANDLRPQFRFVFGGKEQSTFRIEYGSQASLFENLDGVFGAFMDQVPSTLRAAIESAADAQKVIVDASWAKIDAAKVPEGFQSPLISAMEIKEMIVADLLALNENELSKVTTVCTQLAEKKSSVLASNLNFPMGYEVLCTMTVADQSEALQWLEKTRASSCVPHLSKTRIWDTSAKDYLPKSYCPGSGQSGACVDSGGNFLGGVNGRLTLSSSIKFNDDSFALESVGMETFKTIRPAEGAQDCKNLKGFAMTATKTSETDLEVQATSVIADNCRMFGRVRGLEVHFAEFVGPKMTGQGWNGKMTLQKK